MKKILIALCFMLGMAGITTAQTAKKKAPAATTIEKAATVKKVKGLKKDGTADKRFKENKVNSEEVRLKKNGTPDKRFKRNKLKKG